MLGGLVEGIDVRAIGIVVLHFTTTKPAAWALAPPAGAWEARTALGVGHLPPDARKPRRGE